MSNKTKTRYGIAEWYGQSFTSLSPPTRRTYAEYALGQADDQHPRCPFQTNQPQCSKKGGVCSIQRYTEGNNNRLGDPVGESVITCPNWFGEESLVNIWLAEVAGFPFLEIQVAREVPFMRSTETDKPAGKIDMIVAHVQGERLNWHGLEIQAVYFSGTGMRTEFEAILNDHNESPPFPSAIRRPDWRSSSAKRLMPQLEIKAPTIRRWGAKLAVGVDRSFFDAIGGASDEPIHDINEGDIIWLVTRLERTVNNGLRLVRDHWEVLTLEDSNKRLQAAETVSREHFEAALWSRLRPL